MALQLLSQILAPTELDCTRSGSCPSGRCDFQDFQDVWRVTQLTVTHRLDTTRGFLDEPLPAFRERQNVCALHALGIGQPRLSLLPFCISGCKYY